MKKVFALLLALLMAAFVIPACAETLEVVPGTPANCSFSDFQNWFDLSIASSGYDYTFVWDSTPYSEDGFDVYTARMENGPEFKVYTVGGNFCYLIATNSGSFQLSDSSGAKSFGECLGAVLGGGITGLFIPEQGINAFQSQISSFQSDINPLLTILMSGFSSPSKLSDGVAGTVTAMGYPTGMEISGNVAGSTITLTMKIVITSKGCQLNVK